jgi:hypothetical protein
VWLETLFAAISIFLQLVAGVTPFIYGLRRTSLRNALLLGWGLLLTAALWRDLIAPSLANAILGDSAGTSLAPDTPSTAVALMGGWLLACALYLTGRGVRLLWRGVRRE